MTTPAAERHYLARHEHEVEGRGYAVFNPHGKPIADLPVIYGFNNGGSPGWYSGVLLAEDGTCLGGHACSHEGYMTHDLGVLEGSRPDRHEMFRKHYPDGYRMDFVPMEDFHDHEGLKAALERNHAKAAEAEATSIGSACAILKSPDSIDWLVKERDELTQQLGRLRIAARCAVDELAAFDPDAVGVTIDSIGYAIRTLRQAL